MQLNKQELEAKYHTAARELYPNEDDVVIPDDAAVVEGWDNGAFVRASLWVPGDKVGRRICDRCGAVYFSEKDYGLCPECDDECEGVQP